MSEYEHNLFRSCIDWIFRHSLLVGVLLILTTGGALWRASDVSLDANVLHLLRDDDPVLESYQRLQRHVRTVDSLFVAVSQGTDRDISALSKKMETLGGVKKVFPMDVTSDGRSVLAINLAVEPTDVGAVETVIDSIWKTAQRQGVDVRMTGSPAFLVQADRSLKEDLRRAMLIATCGVVLLFLLFFHLGWLALLALIPVGLGMIWGIGVASFWIERVTLLSSVVPTLIVGLGIDYCIHLVQTTAVLERERPSAETVQQAFATIAGPIAIGAITTSGAFFSMTTASLAGIAQMGIVGGLCVLGVFLAVMVTFPLFLTMCPSKWLRRQSSVDRLLLAIAPHILNWKNVVVVGAALLCAVSVAGVTGLDVSSDLNRLQNPSLPAKKLQEELADSPGIGTAPLMVEFARMADARRFVGAFDSGSARQSIRVVPLPQGALALVPPAGDAFSQKGYNSAREKIDQAAMTAGAFPLRISGAPAVNARMAELLKDDFSTVLAFALVVTAVCLMLGFGELGLAILAFIPLGCALLWTAGVMGFAGVPLNVMTLAVAPLIIGVGVDDGVHILKASRLHEGDLKGVFRRTGVAVVATTLTTVIAFGSLVFSSTRGLVQFGWQASLGLFLCMLASLTILPVLHRLWADGGNEHQRMT